MSVVRAMFCALLVGATVALAVPVSSGVAAADTHATPAMRQQAIQFVIQRALSQRGVPYTYGGGNAAGPTVGTGSSTAAGITPLAEVTPVPVLPGQPAPAPVLPTPATPGVAGFDASGLVQYAFAGAGLRLPRSSGEQYKVGRKVTAAQALPGDLIFFGPDGTQSVALFIGNGQMVEATEPVVTVSPVRTATMAPYLSRVIEW